MGGTNPSLLEAMASNSLICSHDNIFNKSILGNDAFYFTNAEQVIDLINNNMKSTESQIIQNNQDKIKNLYSWNKITDDYNSFFHKISNK